MLFNSIDFLLFLPIVILAFFFTPKKFRWILLLAASYFFYMSWQVEYIFLIIFSTLIDYTCALLMERSPSKKSKLPFLIISICSNLGLLLFFKYFNFAAENVNILFDKLEIGKNVPLMSFLLPVGISFYTFQTLSYSIDVYLGKQKAEKHLGYFALYVSFFPQLVAGPIERFSRLAPQLKTTQKFSYSNLVHGLRLILYGLFIKMVIADNLAPIVDQIYAAPNHYSSLDVFTGILFYSFQIYCDFYGYSIIAIGSAQLMGIKLMDNFKTPYLAKSITEFWQRWHISLSTWFRDYLYLPLGGNRVRKSQWVLNILVVFVVSGIWHGANWTFLIWGALYGVLYLLENAINRMIKLNSEHKPFSFMHIILAIKTFLVASLIWVFFRSPSLQEALEVFKALFSEPKKTEVLLTIPSHVWLWLSIFIFSDLLLYNKRFDTWIDKTPLIARWGIYSVLIFSIIFYAGVESFPFIYFQF